MKKLLMIIAASFLAAPSALASNYNYVSPETVKTWIETRIPVMIVDIQVKEDFEAHRLPGSVATYAYPVKTNVEKTRLDNIVRTSMEKDTPVVIVCPRGGGGAKRCYDYLKSRHLPESRLLILKNGIAGWPYKELLETGR